MKEAAELTSATVEKENALSKAVAEYRAAIVTRGREEAQRMLKAKTIDEPFFQHLMEVAESIERKSNSELLPDMLNNLWCHLPGGMYRDDGQTPSGDNDLHAAVDTFIHWGGYQDVAGQIVRRDPEIDQRAAQEFLSKLYLELWGNGFGWKRIAG